MSEAATRDNGNHLGYFLIPTFCSNCGQTPNYSFLSEESRIVEASHVQVMDSVSPGMVCWKLHPPGPPSHSHNASNSASVMIVYCRSFIRDSLLCATERGTLPSPPGVGPMEHHLCLQRGGGNAIHKGSSQPHYLPSS